MPRTGPGGRYGSGKRWQEVPYSAGLSPAVPRCGWSFPCLLAHPWGSCSHTYTCRAHAHMHVHTHTHTQACTHIHRHTCTCTRTHIHRHAHARHMYTHRHTCTPTRTHAHTHMTRAQAWLEQDLWEGGALGPPGAGGQVAGLGTWPLILGWQETGSPAEPRALPPGPWGFVLCIWGRGWLTCAPSEPETRARLRQTVQLREVN